MAVSQVLTVKVGVNKIKPYYTSDFKKSKQSISLFSLTCLIINAS